MSLNENLVVYIGEDFERIFNIFNKETNLGIPFNPATDIGYFSIKETPNNFNYIDQASSIDPAKAALAVLAGDQGLIYEYFENGFLGNDYSVEYINPDKNDAVLNIEFEEIDSNFKSEKNIKVFLATDGIGLIINTANEIKSAIDANENINSVIDITIPGTGLDIVTAFGKTFLSGGSFGGFEFEVTVGQINVTISRDRTIDWPEFTAVYDIVIIRNGKRLTYIEPRNKLPKIEIKRGATE